MTCSADEASPPRTSFSYDHPHEPDVLSPGSGRDHESQSPEFEFSVSRSLELESSADELFSNGMILPLQTEWKPFPVPDNKAPNRLPPIVPIAKKEERSSRGGLGIGFPIERASSRRVMEDDVDFPRKSVFCSLPFLPRSNSTGSALSTKRAQSRQSSITMRKSLSVPSSSSSHSRYQKNASGRSQGHHAVRVSPVLNVPTPCIGEGTSSFFGLGSWLCGGGKDKKSGKR